MRGGGGNDNDHKNYTPKEGELSGKVIVVKTISNVFNTARITIDDDQVELKKNK